jgi:hypothetical protein
MSWDAPNPSGQRPSPFTAPKGYDPYAPPPRSSSGGWLFAIGGGGCLVVVLLCCGGGVGGMYLMKGVMEAEIKEELRDNPKLRAEIGDLQSVQMDLTASLAEDDDEVFRYNARGSDGSGELTVKQRTEDDGSETVLEASLRVDGKNVPIVP